MAKSRFCKNSLPGATGGVLSYATALSRPYARVCADSVFVQPFLSAELHDYSNYRAGS